MNKTLATVTLLSLTLAACSNAPTTLDQPPEALNQFARQGELESCLPLSRIRETRVLDSQHILFELKGQETYLNKLPNQCSSLGLHKAFSYSTSLNKLCHQDIITVFDSSSPVANQSCGLGMFEKLERLEQPTDDDS